MRKLRIMVYTLRVALIIWRRKSRLWMHAMMVSSWMSVTCRIITMRLVRNWLLIVTWRIIWDRLSGEAIPWLTRDNVLWVSIHSCLVKIRWWVRIGIDQFWLISWRSAVWSLMYMEATYSGTRHVKSACYCVTYWHKWRSVTTSATSSTTASVTSATSSGSTFCTSIRTMSSRMMAQRVFIILKPHVPELLIHWKLGKLFSGDPSALFLHHRSRNYSWVMTKSA